MSSQRRIEASRANGARSRGPVSVEGKQRSALNAVRHGMLAKTVVLADENPENFQLLLDSLTERLQPVGDLELGFVEEMAAARWRQGRAWAVESRLLDNTAAAAAGDAVDRITHAFSTLAAGPELNLLHRYETRQTRIFQRALHNLLLLRKQKSTNEPNPNCEHGLTPVAALDPEPEPAAAPAEASHPGPPPAPHPLLPIDLADRRARVDDILRDFKFDVPPRRS